MAIFEAQLFLDRSDPEPIANFTSTMMARDVPGGRYIQAAQDEALSEALDSAGFGIQLVDLLEASGGSGYGSEIPLAQVEAAVGSVKQPVPVEREETPAPAAVPETPPQTAPTPAEPVSAPPTVEIPVQEPPAVAVTAPPAVETPVRAAPDVPEETPTEEAPTPAEAPKNETAGVLHLLGGAAQAAAPKAKAVPQAQAAPTVEGPQSEQTTEEPAAPVTYTEDMSVEEIRERITVEQAMAVPVDFGTCKGWTLGQVLDRRPSSLRFYVYAAKEASSKTAARQQRLGEQGAAQAHPSEGGCGMGLRAGRGSRGLYLPDHPNPPPLEYGKDYNNFLCAQVEAEWSQRRERCTARG